MKLRWGETSRNVLFEHTPSQIKCAPALVERRWSPPTLRVCSTMSGDMLCTPHLNKRDTPRGESVNSDAIQEQDPKSDQIGVERQPWSPPCVAQPVGGASGPPLGIPVQRPCREKIGRTLIERQLTSASWQRQNVRRLCEWNANQLSRNSRFIMRTVSRGVVLY